MITLKVPFDAGYLSAISFPFPFPNLFRVLGEFLHMVVQGLSGSIDLPHLLLQNAIEYLLCESFIPWKGVADTCVVPFVVVSV
jgi:hypothetical protein